MNIEFHSNTTTGVCTLITDEIGKIPMVKLHVDDDIVQNQTRLVEMLKASYRQGQKDLKDKIEKI